MSARRRLSRRAAAALVGALCATAAIAMAAGATKKSTVTVGENAGGTATTPRCAKGQLPALAGFTTTLAQSGPYVHPRALVLSGRSIRAAAVNEPGPSSGGGSGELTAIAYCGSVSYPGKATAENTVLPGSRTTATARCPKRTSVALGGFRADIAPSGHGPLVYVDGLERVSARKWRASAINQGNASGRLEAIAYCAAGAAPLTAVSKSVVVSPGQSRTVTATCSNGKAVALGGVRSEHYGPGYGELQLSSMTRAGKRSWRVGALKFANIVGRLTAIAYCR